MPLYSVLSSSTIL